MRKTSKAATMRRRRSAMTALCLLPSCAAYGVDCSFPIHNVDTFERNTQEGTEGCTGMEHRLDFFEEYMEGCHDHYDEERCHKFDDTVLFRNNHQPQSMVNFTNTGFKKISGNHKLKALLSEFWDTNQNNTKAERWEYADIHTNHWKAPTEMANIWDLATPEFRQSVLDSVQPVIESWTGMKQISTSTYGVRVYRDGAVLMPHCDRMPLVSSAIINVAQDVDEDWPLEVYDRDGKATNITMESGDVVLYESGSLVHGRPFPLKGRYYANIFIHFAPIGFLNGEPFENKDDPDIPPFFVAGSPSAELYKEGDGDSLYIDPHMAAEQNDVEKLRLLAMFEPDELDEEDDNGWQPLHMAVRAGAYEATELLLDYEVDYDALTIIHGRPMDVALRHLGSNHPVTELLRSHGATVEELGAHRAARANDVALLLAYDAEHLFRFDHNGWQPLHEAVRAGHTEAVKILLDSGADYNARTFNGIGSSPLHLAIQYHGQSHPVVQILKEFGALDIASDLVPSMASTETHVEI